MSTFQDAGKVLLTATPPPGVLPAVALWMFKEQEPVQRVLHRLKYANCPWIGIEIGARLGEILKFDRSCRSNMVVPVPLPADRRSARGYNQREWIARGVAATLGTTLATDVLVRVRATGSQTKLSQNERLKNLKGAFKILGRKVAGQHVVLIDDTVTTGATLMACADVLVEAGARSVLPAAAAAAPLRAALEPDPGFSVILS